MKKKIFAALVIMMGVTMGAVAQISTANNKITAKAVVMQAITVEGIKDLNFGNIVPNSFKTVPLTGPVTGSAVGEKGANSVGDETPGVFSVSAASGTSVKFTFAVPSTLTGPESKTLPIVSYVYGLSENGAYESIGVDFTAGSADFTMNDTDVYAFVGATVTPRPTQESGTYTGTITLTATYN